MIRRDTESSPATGRGGAMMGSRWRSMGIAALSGLLAVSCAAEEMTGRDTDQGSGGAGGAAGFGPVAGGAAGTGAFGNSAEQPGLGQMPVATPQEMLPLVDDGSCNQDVDIVFVLDVSGSMIPPLQTLEAEVGMVDAALQTKNLPSPPHYGLVVFVDDVVVANGGAPYADITALTSAISAEIGTTTIVATRQADSAVVEGNLSWPENSLDGLYRAATEFNWRPAETTLRTIIHITDASFWDLERVSSAAGDPMNLEPPGQCSNSLLAIGGPAACTMTSSVHSYDETIQALRDQDIWVNTFSAKTGGPPATGISPESHGAFRGIDVNVGIGFHEPYDGRNSIAESTGGLSWDIDEVFVGIISLATPINESVVAAQCVEYPPPPPPPPPPE